MQRFRYVNFKNENAWTYYLFYVPYGGDTIKIGFIGPGKVGVSLGRYFTHKGIKLSGFYGKNINTIKEGANITNSKPYDNIQEIIEDSDILLITTPDDIISTIDRELSKFDLNNKSICHTSGSLKSNVLYNAKHSGALIYSFHPIFAFSTKDTNLNELGKIYFSIEGDVFEKSSLINLVKILGNKYFIRTEEDAVTYHLANVFVSNLMLSLLNTGISYFKKLNLSEKEALKALQPLVEGNIESIFKKGFVNSLTGPVARGDITTVLKHLSVLEGEDKELYKILSLNLLKLVALKGNKAVDIISEKEESLNFNNENSMEALLSNSKKHLEIFKVLGGLE